MTDVTLQTISPGYQSTNALNNNFSAIKSALADSLSKSQVASNAMTTNLDMNGYKILNTTFEGATIEYTAEVAGDLSMNQYSIINLKDGVDAQDAVNVQQLEGAVNTHESALNPHPQYATGGVQDTHSSRTDNPHGVTATQVGAYTTGQVDTALAEEADARQAHEADVSNPHNVTAAQAGADPAGTASSEVGTHASLTETHGAPTGERLAHTQDLWISRYKAIPHNFTTDADYTLTTEQEKYGRIILTDTTPVLTAARSVIVSTDERPYVVQNDTAQTLTVKTSAGTGVGIAPGADVQVQCDGTNVVEVGRDFAAMPLVAGLPVTDYTLGENQAWIDETANRSFGVTYTNTTGRAIQVYISGSHSDDRGGFDLYVGGLAVARQLTASTTIATYPCVTAIVPPGATYRCVDTVGNVGTPFKWSELK